MLSLVLAFSLGQIQVYNQDAGVGVAAQKINCTGGVICAVSGNAARLSVTFPAIPDAGNPVQQTGATLALFVDGTLGNDNNTCTASGTSACLTIQAAMNLVPKLVRHPVTVDITAGSYAGFTVAAFTFAPVDVTNGAFLNIRGAAQTNVTPATGSATGTFTSTALDAVGFSVPSDSGATWTVNDFSGRFLTLTGGTGAGQVLPIISNTATSITVSGTFSPAVVGGSTTYAITSPATLINASVSNSATATAAAGVAAGIQVVDIASPRTVGAFVNIQDIGHDSGSFTMVAATSAVGLNLLRVRNSISSFLSAANGSVVTLTGASVPVGSIAVGSSSGVASSVRLTNGYLSSASGTVSMASQGTGNLFQVQNSELVTTGTSSISAPILAQGGAGTSVAIRASRLRCTSASANASLFLKSNAIPTPTVLQVGPASASIQGVSSLEGCGTGIYADGSVTVLVDGSSLGSVTFLSNTIGVSATGGAHVSFALAVVPAFTTNGTDMSIDGTTSTRAAFVALVPNAIVNLSFLSAIYLQP